MKKYVCFLVVVLFVVISGCKKGVTPATKGIYKGIVLFSVCSHSVVQTIGPDYLGEDTWVSGTSAGAPVYHHVFAVQNGCQFQGKPGDSISFTIIAPQVQNCFYCMIAVAVPDSSYAIQTVN